MEGGKRKEEVKEGNEEWRKERKKEKGETAEERELLNKHLQTQFCTSASANWLWAHMVKREGGGREKGNHYRNVCKKVTPLIADYND